VPLQFQAKQLFKPLPLCLFASAIDFLCGFALCVPLQFQAKQLLNLCRFTLFTIAIDFLLLVCLVCVVAL